MDGVLARRPRRVRNEPEGEIWATGESFSEDFGLSDSFPWLPNRKAK